LLQDLIFVSLLWKNRVTRLKRFFGEIMNEWYLYLIRTRQGALYTGISTDVLRRFDAHLDGKGAKYLRARGPLTLVYQAKIGSRALATKAEYRIKKLRKKKKEQIVSEHPEGLVLMTFLGLLKPKKSLSEN